MGEGFAALGAELVGLVQNRRNPPLLAEWWIQAFGWRGAYVALSVFVLVLGGAAAGGGVQRRRL